MTVDDVQVAGSYRVPASPKGSRFGEEEVEQVRSLLLSDVHLANKEVCAKFEAHLRDYLGAVDVVAVSSCTTALELVTRYLNLSADSQIVASPLTFQATTASLLDRGCQIRWCDIDDDTLSMSPRHLRELLSPDVKAVYLTHYGGDIARIDEICSLADEYDIRVIEDCAHALGSTLRGRAAGTWGDFGCFSFHSLKNISTLGTGGAITTSSREVADELRGLRDVDALTVLRPTPNPFGGSTLAQPLPVGEGHEGSAFTHECEEVLRGGINAAMGDVAAAVGIVQLQRLPELLSIRSSAAARLDMALDELPGVQPLRAREGVQHSHHLYTFLAQSRETRDAILWKLHEGGVEIVQRYFPLHLLPEYRFTGGRLGQCPTAEFTWFERLVNLPINPWLTDDDVDYMASLIREAVVTVDRIPEPITKIQ